MRILITRPEPDAAELKAAIEALGHEVSIEPLLRIEPMPIEAGALEGARGLIATSRNGLRALAASGVPPQALRLPVVTVGPATSELARELGFQRVIEGPGTASELVGLITAEAELARGPLVHVAGDAVAFDLAGELAARGIEVREVAAYRAVAARALTPQTAQSIANGSLDAVILMSPRTAAIFTELVGTARLREQARRLICLCLSQGVANALRDLAPARIEIALRPNSEAIVAVVGRVATQSSGV